MDERLLRDIEVLQGLMQDGGWTSVCVRSGAISLNLSERRTPILPPNKADQLGAKTAEREKRNEPGQTAPAPTHADIDPAWTAVNAPNLGTFYRSPKPGSPPFVEIGHKVEKGSELCLIEVMKLFTSVRAEIGGTIRHIAAADAQLVEGGQPLMYIETE